MQSKAKLLQSVSAVTTAAAAAAVGGTAFAQSGMPGVEKYTYSVQGGWLLAQTPDDSLIDGWADKLGRGFPGVVVQQDFRPQVGVNGAATLGVTFDSGWDTRVGFAFSEFPADTASVAATIGSSFTGYFDGGSYTSSRSFKFEVDETKTFGFETADFEVGFTPTLGPNLDVRLFAGIRGLHFHSDDVVTTTYSFSSSFSNTLGVNEGFSGQFSVANAAMSDFFGAGPRVGVSLEKRFDGTNFGVSGQVAGAVIVGTQTDRTSVTFTSSFSEHSGASSYSHSFSSGGPSTSKSYTKTVLDAQAQAGIDYYLNDKTKLTFGYQVETLTNVGVGANSGQNQVAQGGFVKVGGSF